MPTLRVHTENTRSLPHILRPTEVESTSSAWLQLCPIGNSTLRFARLIEYEPPWASSVSRPKNTVGSPETDVSQFAGIHSWSASAPSKPGLRSRFFETKRASAAVAYVMQAASAASTSPRRAKRSRGMRILSGAWNGGKEGGTDPK